MPDFISYIYTYTYFTYFICKLAVSFILYSYTRKRRASLRSSCSLFSLAHHVAWCNLKFACSYIADLLLAWILSGSSNLRPFLFRSSRRRSSIYSLMWADYLRVCTREWNPRDDHLLLLWDDHRYSPCTECKCAQDFFRPPFVRFLFIANLRERSSRSVTSFALRRSSSCKTRFASYTTIPQLSGRQGKEEGRTKKMKGGKKKSREINLLFWEYEHCATK